MRKYFLYLLLFEFFSSSCKKEHKNSPSPPKKQVIDAVSQKGIPFTAVYLLQNNKGASSAMGEKQIGYVLTDSNGYFHYDSLALDNGKYDYYVRASSRYYYARGDVTYSADGNVLVYMDPKGFVKVSIQDMPPKDKINGIYFSLLNHTFTDKDTSSGFIAESYGNKNTEIGVQIEKTQGGVIHYLDTIYIKELDTINYVIKY